jgi:hypothetical protein
MESMTCEQFPPKPLILNDHDFYFKVLYTTTSHHTLFHRAGEYESVCQRGYTLQKPHFWKGSEAGHGSTAALKEVLPQS